METVRGDRYSSTCFRTELREELLSSDGLSLSLCSFGGELSKVSYSLEAMEVIHHPVIVIAGNGFYSVVTENSASSSIKGGTWAAQLKT